MRKRRTTTRTRKRVGTMTALAAVLLLATAAPSAAQDEDGTDPAEETDSLPGEAGSDFRTAAVLGEIDQVTTNATIGEYLYWVFPVGAGQNATAGATVTFEDELARSGDSTWRLDLYDGLRRRQACVDGTDTATASAEQETVALNCELRTVRSWAEPWSNDPLPGSYYLRLTAVDLPDEDLGLPISVVIEADAENAGGSRAYGGNLSAPLVPTPRAGTVGTGEPFVPVDETEDPDTAYAGVVGEPDGGWNGGWWSDRWLWTAGGGLLGAIAAIGGYSLIRHPRNRTHHTHT
jgi:hypothetical protein